MNGSDFIICIYARFSPRKLSFFHFFSFLSAHLEKLRNLGLNEYTQKHSILKSYFSQTLVAKSIGFAVI